MNNDTVFQYHYSASQNKEVQAIREKYLPKTESKFEELKRLDHCVHNSGVAQALIIGVLGCLLFGLGMCFSMQVIGQSKLLGLFLGACGLFVMVFAYPVYRSMFKRAKEKYQPRILELAAELCGQEQEHKE